MKPRWINTAIIAAGVLLCLSTLLLPVYDKWRTSRILATFETETEDGQTEEKYRKMFEKAEEYNSLLLQTRKSGVRLKDEPLLSDESYNELLNFGDGVMGSIEIPKISLTYPIYHTTDEEILNTGIGHLQSTSLPTGTTGTHAVFSGHRGLPTAKLFTRLDELAKGDLFFLNIGDRKFAYRINDIRVVEPSDTSVTEIDPDRDIVSLVTCTPYGINSHRLVVTGERVEITPEEEAAIKKSMPSITEMLIIAAPFAMVFILLMSWINRNRCSVRY